MLKEAGWSLCLEIQVDASATIGTVHRRGLGKLRHLEVEALWLHDVVEEKRARMIRKLFLRRCEMTP